MFKQTGYIYLLDDNNWQHYNNNYKTQLEVGANIERLTPEGVQNICKGILNVDGIKAAASAGGESGKVILPGNAANSLLWQQVESGDMPPQGAPNSCQ